MPKEGSMRVFPLNQYVCKRDGEGNLLEIVVKETVSVLGLDEEVREQVLQQMSKEDAKSETHCDLYTHIYKLGDKKFYVCQEVKGIKIPSSVGEHNADQLPWLALRMVRVDSESYGRTYVEEFIGDLKSLEGLSQALVESAAASAKMVFLVKPNSTTKKMDIAKSRNGDIISGSRDDVSVLQAEKFYDLQTVEKSIGRLEERLAYAFLLNTAIQRQAERVTAQEIRYMANELETAMGGIYSLLSQELQLPLVALLMTRMGSKNEIPKLPKGSVRPTIITGVEALGRGNDLQKLREFVQDITALAGINPEATQLINANDLIYYDKLEPKKNYKELGIRVVPPGVVRYGAFCEPGVVVMPGFVNIGAYVGSGTMVDTWATVGSCAQIGKNVHLSGGVGIGGVLEPAGAMPVVIEDGAFIGSRSIIVEGIRIKKGAVIGANVTLTASTPIIDVTGKEPVEVKGVVEENSVVIPGTRPKEFPSGTFNTPCALVIGKRKESTDEKTSLNDALRTFGVEV